MVKKRLSFLEENCGFDYVVETRDVSFDFTEFVVSCGGDIIRYRVYGTNECNFRIVIK